MPVRRPVASRRNNTAIACCERRVTIDDVMDFVTMKRLNRALATVVDELERHGFYDDKLERVDVYLTYVGGPYGWQHYATSGGIDIPSVSMERILDLFRGGYTTLTDVLRHEFGHAVADTHRGLIRSRQFSEAYGAAHESKDEWEYDPDFHVSEYAATSVSEDFAEIFMLYLKHKGRLPNRYSTPYIRPKWRFVRALAAAIRRGKARW
jgi:hypothetical protein